MDHKERVPTSRRRLLQATPFLAGAFFIGLSPTSIRAQEPADVPASGEYPLVSHLVTPTGSEEWQPVSGKPWKKTRAQLSDSQGKVSAWEKTAFVLPDDPYTFNHDPAVGSWSMSQSLVRAGLLLPDDEAFIAAQFQLSQTTNNLNAGLMIHNNEPARGGNHRRLFVGVKGLDLVAAYWDGSSEGRYVVNTPALHQFTPDEDGSIHVQIGVILNSAATQARIMVEDSQPMDPIDLGGTALYDPTGTRRLDIAASTTAGVTNRINQLMSLKKLPSSDIKA